MPPARAERTIREKRRFAFSVCPSPHGLCYEGAAACAEHESDTGENHDGGKDQVDRGECRLAHII